MVNKPLIRPYFWGGSFGGGVARIPMILQVTSTIQPWNLVPFLIRESQAGQQVNGQLAKVTQLANETGRLEAGRGRFRCGWFHWYVEGSWYFDGVDIFWRELKVLLNNHKSTLIDIMLDCCGCGSCGCSCGCHDKNKPFFFQPSVGSNPLEHVQILSRKQ